MTIKGADLLFNFSLFCYLFNLIGWCHSDWINGHKTIQIQFQTNGHMAYCYAAIVLKLDWRIIYNYPISRQMLIVAWGHQIETGRIRPVNVVVLESIFIATGINRPCHRFHVDIVIFLLIHHSITFYTSNRMLSTIILTHFTIISIKMTFQIHKQKVNERIKWNAWDEKKKKSTKSIKYFSFSMITFA